MYRIYYPFLVLISFLGTRLWGLHSTVKAFQKYGAFRSRWGLIRPKSPEQIETELMESFHVLPFSIRCLDQAIVTWYLLRLRHYVAELNIGVCVSPFLSHAWVNLGGRIFVDSVYIADMQIVASYPSKHDTPG